LVLPLSLGVADGILNALTLASGAVLHRRGLDLWMASRIGIVAFVSAVFTVFVAVYAQSRAEVARAERELSLTTTGRLAAGALGRRVTREAVESALAAGVSSFAGAIVPLAVGVSVRHYSWTALAVAVARARHRLILARRHRLGRLSSTSAA
jgi:predicted membrane protein (TIGR00267 family)